MAVDDFAPLRFLRPGEQLLWHGKPDPAVWFTPADLYVIPITVLWCGFAIFWDVGPWRAGVPVAFYDVADPEPMLAALDQAGESQAKSEDSWQVP